MAQYFKYDCLPWSGGSVVDVAACQTEPLIAVATSSNKVVFYQDEGTRVTQSVERGSAVCKLAWHPNRSVLAIGWEDGVITTVNAGNEFRRAEEATIHRAAISLCEWNDDGTRLVTADRDGIVGVWATEDSGAVRSLHQYRRKAAITHLAFLPIAKPSQRPAADGKKQRKRPPLTSFFVGGEDEVVSYADDAGQCTDVLQKLNSPVSVLRYDATIRRLVVITAAHVMTHVAVAPDGHISTTFRAKIAMRPNANISQSTWAGAALLATSSPEEAMVRVWDVSCNENFTLPLSHNGSGVPRSDRILAMAFDQRKAVLAVGTRGGRVVFFRHLGRVKPEGHKAVLASGDRDYQNVDGSLKLPTGGAADSPSAAGGADGRAGDDSDGEDDSAGALGRSGRNRWEVAQVVEFADSVHSVSWSSGSSMLAVGLDGGARVLAETVLQRTIAGPLAAMQIGKALVVLEHESPGPKMVLRTDIPVKGLDISVKHVLVHNRRQLQVFRVPDAPDVTAQEATRMSTVTNLRRDAAFECHCDAAAVYSDSVLACVGGKFVAYNFGGTIKHAEQFGEQDGVPKYMSSNGKYVAIVTTHGLIVVYDVSRTRPRETARGHFFRDMRRGNGAVSPQKTGKDKSQSRLLGFESPDRSPRGSMARGGGRGGGSQKEAAPELDSMRLEALQVSVNADGSRVALITTRSEEGMVSSGGGQAAAAGGNGGTGGTGGGARVVDSRVYVFCVSSGTVTSYDVGSDRSPSSVCWDDVEPKLMAIQTERGAADGSSVAVSAADDDGEEGKDDGLDGLDASVAIRKPRREVLTVFSTPDGEMVQQDSVPLQEAHQAVLGLRVPSMYFVSRASAANVLGRFERSSQGAAAGDAGTGGSAAAAGAGDGEEAGRSDDEDGREAEPPTIIAAQPLRDFVGIGSLDDDTKAALLEFSYQLACGNMDAAFQAVQKVDSPAVWRNMAYMSVQSRRLDVAELCLGHMGHVRGARAVREARREPEPEARVAMVAIQLGLLTDAARLYQECGRYDLLSRLFRSAGEWERAQKVTDSKDKLHSGLTRFLHARHLESVGELKKAIAEFESAGNGVHRREVPRLLKERGNLRDLEHYAAMRSKDREFCEWMGKFAEHLNNYDTALRYYDKAHRPTGIVRVLCKQGKVERAAEFVREQVDKAPAFALARHMEATDRQRDALSLYAKSGRHDHAARLAMRQGMDHELMQSALQASKLAKLEVAQYYESKGRADMAVQLYQRAGQVEKALALCFEGRLFSNLGEIAKQLDASADPAVLSRCAAFFVEHKEYTRAVDMMVKAGRAEEALDMAVEHRVRITEEMAEALSPSKDPPVRGSRAFKIAIAAAGGDAGVLEPENWKRRRVDVLLRVARACRKQGLFHLATKKYTQAGERTKAMRCLLKSGDTQKIIYFANLSRSREIYILGANYLQSLDWRSNPKILKAIISFYSKARAHDLLANFYDACAQVEMGDYSNYEKALSAEKEALKFAQKLGDADGRVTELQGKVATIERFVQAQRAAKAGEVGKMEEICTDLLRERGIERSLYVGDVYSLLVKHYVSADPRRAAGLVRQMAQRGVRVEEYVDEQTLRAIEQATNEPLDISSGRQRQGARGGGRGGAADADEVDDDIPDEIDG